MVPKDSEITRDEINNIAQELQKLGYDFQTVCLSRENKCYNTIARGDYRATVKIAMSKDMYGSILMISESSQGDEDAKTALETAYLDVFKESRGLEMISRKGLEEQIIAGLESYGYDVSRDRSQLTCGSEYCMSFMQMTGPESEKYKVKITTGIGDYIEKGAHVDISVLATAPDKSSDRIADRSEILRARIQDVLKVIYEQEEAASGDILRKETSKEVPASS